MGDLMPKDERLLQGFVVGPPITDEEAAKLVIAVSGSTVTPEEIVKAKDALALIRQTDASYRQLSKALCGKENATLEEVLQAASQVKCGYSIPARNGKSLALMQSQRIAELEQELADVKRERDAAVADLRKMATEPNPCSVCKNDHRIDPFCKIHQGDCSECGLHCPCEGCFDDCEMEVTGENFQWRGVCPENTEVQEDDH